MSARQMDRRLQSQKREQKRKIYGRLNLIQRLRHRDLALAQQRPRLGPTRVNVGQVQRVSELPFGRIPGMRNQVDLAECRCLDIPTVRLRGIALPGVGSGFR